LEVILTDVTGIG